MVRRNFYNYYDLRWNNNYLATVFGPQTTHLIGIWSAATVVGHDECSEYFANRYMR